MVILLIIMIIMIMNIIMKIILMIIIMIMIYLSLSLYIYIYIYIYLFMWHPALVVQGRYLQSEPELREYLRNGVRAPVSYGIVLHSCRTSCTGCTVSGIL